MIVRASVRLLTFALLGALLAAHPVRGQSGAPATLDLDPPRALSGSRQQARATVLDTQGNPVLELGTSSFRVRIDGREARELSVTRWSEAYPSLRLTVLADPDLLTGESGAALGTLFQSLASVARDGDRIKLITLAERPKAREQTMKRAAELAEHFTELSDGEPSGRLFDALFDAVEAAAGEDASIGQAVFIVTRGRESGSRRGPLDVLALSRLNGARVPVHVLLVEDGTPAESDRMSRLADQSGGGFARSAPGLSMVPGGAQLLARGRGTYLLEYEPPGEDPGAESHVLVVSVLGAAGERTAQVSYAASDVRRRALWREPLPWVIVAVVSIAAGLFFARRLRRRALRLVVLAGDEKGCSYDVYDLPVNLGAAEGNDVLVVDSSVSRNHAVLERRGAAIELMDLNSENGSFVNGERVTRRRLSPGDRIRLGDSPELRYEG